MKSLSGIWVGAVVGFASLSGSAGAQPLDHAMFDSVLSRYVQDGRVDYMALEAERGMLDRYLAQVAAVDAERFAGWSQAEQIAYLVNAYNAYVLETVIDHYPIEGGGLIKRLFFPDNSVRQIPGMFDGIAHRVAGTQMTLDDIEHGHLRENYNEPRIHFALVCAAMSCPPLREESFRGARLDEQLDDQSRRFLSDPRHNRFEVARGRVVLSKIFDWYGEDFRQFAPASGYGEHDEEVRGILAFAAEYVVDRVAAFLQEGGHEVEFQDYDWTLNDQAIAAASR